MKIRNLFIICLAIIILGCSSLNSTIGLTGNPPIQQPSNLNNKIDNSYQDIIKVESNTLSNSIWFKNNQIDIDKKYNDMLIWNADYLNNNSASRVIIQGNFLKSKIKKLNRKILAVKRAKKIAAKLISLGASSSQISVIINDLKNDLLKKDESRVDIFYSSSPPAAYYVYKTPLISINKQEIILKKID